MKSLSKPVKILSLLLLIALIIIIILSIALHNLRKEEIVYSTSGLTRVIYKYQDMSDRDGSNYYLTILRSYGVPANIEVSKELYEKAICDEKVEYPFAVNTYNTGRVELIRLEIDKCVDNREKDT